jgi:hypothetical protein
MIRRLCATDGADSLFSFIDTLKATEGRPTRVTTARRTAPLLIIGAPVILTAIGIWFMSLLMPAMVTSGTMDLALAPAYASELRALQQAPDQKATETRRIAITKLLSYTYRRAQSTRQGHQLLAQMPPRQRQYLELSAQLIPEVSPAEAAEARREVGVFNSGPFSITVLAAIVIGVGLIGVFAGQFVLTMILGAPPLFRLCGISVQRADGRRAGRLRCLVRGAMLWAPIPLAVAIVGATIGLRVTTFRDVIDPASPALPQSVLWSAVMVVLAAYLCGILYAILRPSRGIPDLITRTHLVPR